MFLFSHVGLGDEAKVNIHDLASDLVVPQATDNELGPGQRVRQRLPEYRDWQLYHILYLPTDWEPGRKYPVIVEYPGNGGFENESGDKSTGRLEDCKLGYGISGGKQFIWVCLPFADTESKQHALTWWGDAEATARYCRTAVQDVCENHGGDPDRVVLTGFSRGAIACNYIGLRDDETAKLWRAMILHSHYDGVRRWGYANDDAHAARKRLQRFAGRPQFITHEMSIDEVRTYLRGSPIKATFLAIPFPNHTDTWVLKDLTERARVRRWLEETLTGESSREGRPSLDCP